jgi:hypothetical protein
MATLQQQMCDCLRRAGRQPTVRQGIVGVRDANWWMTFSGWWNPGMIFVHWGDIHVPHNVTAVDVNVLHSDAVVAALLHCLDQLSPNLPRHALLTADVFTC